MPSPLPLVLGLSLTGTGAALGLVEAVRVATGGAAAPAGERLLAAAWAWAPLALVGGALGLVAATLATGWWLARGAADPGRAPLTRGAEATAALLALGVFTLPLVAAGLYAREAAGGAARVAVAVPGLALAAALTWRGGRRLLDRLDRAVRRPVAAGLGLLALAGAAAVAVRVWRETDALAEHLGGGGPIFALAALPLTALGAGLAWRLNLGARAGLAALAVAALGLAGVVDLVAHLDAHPAVKTRLLGRGHVFRPLLAAALPFFDADGDGHAGRLGGGDCDDSDPRVHPGAREVPGNGVDDDCFGGDAPLPALGRAQAQARARRALAEGIEGARPGTAPAQPLPETLALAPRPHLVLVTIDTLRPDRLGHHGHPRDTSPALDRLAARGLTFLRAYAQGPQTKASMPSVFTGRYTSEVPRTAHQWARTLPEAVTVAERLAAAGYRTVGVPAHNFFKPWYGLNQGFAEWDLSVVEAFDTRTAYEKTGHKVAERALAWLAARAALPADAPEAEQPFFLWLHFFDPHHFYKKHPEYGFGDDEIDRYDAEIRFTDDQLAKVLAVLDTPPFAGRTYVVVHSDHGEGFGEHGYRYHGQHLFEDQIRVPLVLAGPGLAPRRVAPPVSGIDLVPTLVDLAGLPVPAELPGRTLLAYAHDTPPPPRPVYAEMLADANHSDRRVYIEWPYKLQWGITFGELTLHHLGDDPEERHDLSALEPARTRALEAALRRFMAEDLVPFTPRPVTGGDGP